MHWPDVPALRERNAFRPHDARFAEAAEEPERALRRHRRPATARAKRLSPTTISSTTRSSTGRRPSRRALHRLGVAPGDRVVLFLPNDREFVYALLAGWRLGAVAVPVNVREQRPELAFILAQCAAKAIMFDASLADRLPSRQRGCRSPCESARGPAGATTLDELLETRSPAAPAADPARRRRSVILYTSGTTGRPKGAMLTHLNLIHSVLHYRTCMRLTAADRSLLAVPASHVTGLVAITLAMFAVGGA